MRVPLLPGSSNPQETTAPGTVGASPSCGAADSAHLGLDKAPRAAQSFLGSGWGCGGQAGVPTVLPPPEPSGEAAAHRQVMAEGSAWGWGHPHLGRHLDAHQLSVLGGSRPGSKTAALRREPGDSKSRLLLETLLGIRGDGPQPPALRTP